jgi:sulfite oxidase
VNHALALSIDDLKSNYRQHEVLFALQCAGNRRHTMRTEIKEVQGIDWFDGAIMNCLWRGPRLRDVLLGAGIVDDMQNEKGYKGHVAFACFEKPCQEDPWYGGSIPLDRAMQEHADCILALEVNIPLHFSILL